MIEYKIYIKTKMLEKWMNTIYVMSNPCYNIKELIYDNVNIVKIGSTKCLPARYNNYKTYTPINVSIIRYYHILNYDCYQLDDDFKTDLDNYRIHSCGGIEFYKITILDCLEEYMKTRKIEYIRYETIEDFPEYKLFDKLILDDIVKDDIEKYKVFEKLSQNRAQKLQVKPLIISNYLNEHQEMVLNKCIKHYENYDKGILNLFCRYGKTRLSSIFALVNKYNKILVLVPSLYLIEQTFDTWKQFYSNDDIFLISSNKFNNNFDKLEKIKNSDNFENLERLVVISTYHSSNKLKDYKFDLCIYDEAHRTTGEYSNFNKLITSNNISKKLFLTATMKFYDYNDNDPETLIINSMDNTAVYGEIIQSVSAKKALELERICPYSIITMKLEDNNSISGNNIIKIDKIIDKIINNYLIETQITNTYNNNYNDSQEESNTKVFEFIKENKNRYIRIAMGILDVIKKYNIKHIITFHRYVKCAEIFKIILKQLVNNSNSYNIDLITGTNNKKERKTIIDCFQNIEYQPENNQYKIINTEIKYSILCSAKVLQEGVDIPLCDGVCFVDLKSSSVDTIQSLSRCLTFQNNKKAFIIIPYDENDFECNISNIDNNQFEEMKVSNYAINLRLILRNLLELDDNVKEFFRKFILNKQNCIANNNEKDFQILDNQFVKCLIDAKVIEEMSEIVFDIFSVAKAKLANMGDDKYNTPEEYYKSVIKDFDNNLPLNPDKVYRKWGWRGWNDYLGIDPYMTISQVRKFMYSVNQSRIDNQLAIIDTENGYKEYAKENKLMVQVKPKNGNWCWLLLPNYDNLVKKYYNNKEDIIIAIKKLNIKSIDDYEKKSILDEHLIPYKYLRNGFYNDTIPIIQKNISKFIEDCNINEECIF